MTGVGTGALNVAGPDLPMEERETREQARARIEAKRTKVHTPWGKPKTEPATTPTPAPTRTPRPDPSLHPRIDAAAIVQDYISGMTIPKIAKLHGHTRTTVREVLDDTPGLTRRDDRATNGTVPAGRPATAAVRAWAVAEGIAVPAKGILKASLYEEYSAKFGEAAAALLDAPVTPEPDPVTLEEPPAPPAADESCGYVLTDAATHLLEVTAATPDALAAITADHLPTGAGDEHPLVWTVTEAQPSEDWTAPAPDVDGRRRCTACYDLVATLSSRDECDACVAVREALHRVRPPSVEDAAQAYARALKAQLEAQDTVDAASRVLRAAIRAET